MKIDEIGAWEAFHGVAIQGNFSRAAHALKVSVAQISKSVARLEEALGVRLFTRTTRFVALTAEGRALLPRAQALLDDWRGLESSFESPHELSGLVRVTCVPFLAERFLIPLLEVFRREHPRVSFEIEISEGMVNLVEAGLDVAIRIEDEPADSGLVYRKLGPNRLVLCASPDYLRRSGAPLRAPTDLRRHDLLLLGVHADCRFKEAGLRLGELRARQPWASENGWFLTQLAKRDFGVLVRSYWDVRESLDRGELVEVLKRHPLEPFGNIYAVTSGRHLLAPRIRAFLEHLAKGFAGAINSQGPHKNLLTR